MNSDLDPARCLIWREIGGSPSVPGGERRWAGEIGSRSVANPSDGGIGVSHLRTPQVVGPGDVVRLVEDSPRVAVLYRRGSNSNTLLATERCNSLCLMCSQPPREVDDQYLVDEMLETIRLVDRTKFSSVSVVVNLPCLAMIYWWCCTMLGDTSRILDSMYYPTDGVSQTTASPEASVRSSTPTCCGVFRCTRIRPKSTTTSCRREVLGARRWLVSTISREVVRILRSEWSSSGPTSSDCPNSHTSSSGT